MTSLSRTRLSGDGEDKEEERMRMYTGLYDLVDLGLKVLA
jgi:hypothetical protein